jgi:hypothetical protein
MIAMMGSCGIGPVGIVSTAFGCIAAATAGEADTAAAPVATPAVFRNERRLKVFMAFEAPLSRPRLLWEG